MIRDNNGRPRHSNLAPVIEALEDRKLLSSFYTGPSPIRPVQTRGGIYTFTMNGPGQERVKQIGHGQIAVTLLGTTQASTLDVALTRQLPHRPVTPLNIASIKVNSGQLGGITAGNAANLNGPITPLAGPVNTLQFEGLGSNASIVVNGDLGSLGVTNDVNLGPNGKVQIAGSLGASLSVGALNVNGGLFSIGGDIVGSLNAASMNLTQGGRFVVGHDVTGTTKIAGDLAESSNGIFSVNHNLGGLTVGNSITLDSGSQLAIGPIVPGGNVGDVIGTVSVGQDLRISNNAKLTVGRDVTGNFAIGGNLALASNGTMLIGRELNALTVNGSLLVASGGGEITVGGDLTTLTVNGAFVGKGLPSTVPDLSVGLNLTSLNVLGGGADLGGIQNANIAIGKSLLGINVPHGIFNSFITAGVSIDGGSRSGASSVSVGADGADAIYNSEIRAGVSITNLEIGGNVRSTFAVNPTTSTGYRTRIIAGEDRQGNWSSGGFMSNFQITGALIDSVIAASVAPNGGNGTLPPTGYGPPRSTSTTTSGDLGNNTYDQPAGTTTGGTVGTPVVYANYTELSYYNETFTKVAYNPADSTIDDLILGGSINATFASAPLPPTSTATTTTTSSSTGSSSSSGTSTTGAVPALSDPNALLPIPTTSTVLGGVISTTHGDEADYAGIFAADTRGVFVGTLPS